MLEYGAPRAFAEAAAGRCSASFRNAAAALAEVELERTIGSAKVRLEPVGVAGMITPWNASLLVVRLFEARLRRSRPAAPR